MVTSPVCCLMALSFREVGRELKRLSVSSISTFDVVTCVARVVRGMLCDVLWRLVAVLTPM